MQNVNKKIVAIRHIRSLTQEKTAEKANIPFRTYQRVESGETDAAHYLERLGEALQCSVEDILNFDLDTNQFSRPVEVQKMEKLDKENDFLKKENDYLKTENSRLWQTLTGFLSKFSEKRGGG